MTVAYSKPSIIKSTLDSRFLHPINSTRSRDVDIEGAKEMPI